MLLDTYDTKKLRDFVSYESASQQDVHGFMLRQNEGPSEERPLIDMTADLDSPWNKRVVEVLLSKIQASEEAARMGLADTVWRAGIKDRLRHIKSLWKQAQPRAHPETGIVETPNELGERVSRNVQEEMARHRRDTRRNTVRHENCACCFSL